MPKRIRDLSKVSLRLPDEMRKALEDAAKANGRSPTAEAFARLVSTFDNGSTWLDKVRTSPLMQLEKRLMAVEINLGDRIDSVRDDLIGLREQLKQLGILD